MEHVLVLMSTYNGEKYLEEQLDSLINQNNVKISILVRDDGSTDKTISILERYKANGKLDYYCGSNLKPAGSFMHLIMNAPESDFYAFCDQDDVWLPDKLTNAIRSLKLKKLKPAMYYHAMNLVDNNLIKFGYYYRDEKYSKSLKLSYLFGDEIAGCSMVWNNELHRVLRTYMPSYITMHDGWVHRVCLCVKGTVIADKTPYINYRIHGDNAVGMPIRSIMSQIKILLKKENKFSKLAQEILIGYHDYLDEDIMIFLNALSKYRSNLKFKLYLIKQSFSLNASKKEIFKLNIKLLFGSL